MRQDKRLHIAHLEVPLVHERGVNRVFNGPHPCVGLEMLNRRVHMNNAPRDIPSEELPPAMMGEKIPDYRCNAILRVSREDAITINDAVNLVDKFDEENLAEISKRFSEEDLTERVGTVFLDGNFDVRFLSKFGRSPTAADRALTQKKTARRLLAENLMWDNRARIVEIIGWLRAGKLKTYFIEPRTVAEPRYQGRSVELPALVQGLHQRLLNMSVVSSCRYLIQTPDGCLSYVDEGAGLFIAFPMTLVTSLLFTKAVVTKRFAADFFENEDALWPRKAK